MKAAAWVGALLILAGVSLGFVKQGDCGSVFQPRDYAAADAESWANLYAGRDPSITDCTTVTDWTVPVWLLIGAGVVTLIVVAVKRDWTPGDQRTAVSHD